MEDSLAAAPRIGVVRSGFKLGIAAVLVILLAPFAANLSNLLAALPNPFATERHERVQPPVLKSLQDLSEYHAASANLQAVVEVSHDASYVPSFLAGERTLILQALLNLVLNGMDSMHQRAEESERLMDWAFANFENVMLFAGGDVVERVPPESMQAINALKTAKVINPPSTFSINMEMVLKGALTDARVRKALNLSIDRDGITKGILGGLGTPSVGMPGPGQRGVP